MTDKMTVYDFGRKLLETKDLDPVYVILWEAQLDEPLLKKWLLAYWCFYHVGTASWIADHPDRNSYWGAMETAAGSKDWPRSSERRHFRGENARKSVAWLKRQSVGELFSGFSNKPTALEIIAYIQTWRGFGPWIAFKVADMLERLNLLSVRFDLDTAMYQSPREAADVLYEREGRPGSKYTDVPEWATDKIIRQLGKAKAPPRYERAINFQEVETILCKWKSYLNGHYEVGEDVEAVHKGLLRFPECSTAHRLLAGGKKGGLW